MFNVRYAQPGQAMPTDAWNVRKASNQAECVGSCEGCYTNGLLGQPTAEVAPYYLTIDEGYFESVLVYCHACMLAMVHAEDATVLAIANS